MAWRVARVGGGSLPQILAPIKPYAVHETVSLTSMRTHAICTAKSVELTAATLHQLREAKAQGERQGRVELKGRDRGRSGAGLGEDRTLCASGLNKTRHAE